MTMKTLLIAAVVGTLSAGSAFAACTQEDMTRKVTELQTVMAAYLQKNPSKAADVSARAQGVTSKLQGATDPDAVCKAYDELIASMK